MRIFLSVVTSAVLALSIASAQSKPAGAGHWEGAIQLPDRELKIEVDLAQNPQGEWIGSFTLPDQRVKDAPLGKISVKGAAVGFAIEGIPGDPNFKGDLSPDGRTLKGEFTQGGGSLAAELKWISEPHVTLPAKSTAIAKEIEGVWEGTLAIPNGPEIRLRCKLANGANGATGTIASLDQGGVDVPLTTITQKDGKLVLEVKTIGGSFTGELKNGELAGEWTQGRGSLPLVMKRPAPRAE